MVKSSGTHTDDESNMSSTSTPNQDTQNTDNSRSRQNVPLAVQDSDHRVRNTTDTTTNAANRNEIANPNLQPSSPADVATDTPQLGAVTNQTLPSSIDTSPNAGVVAVPREGAGVDSVNYVDLFQRLNLTPIEDDDERYVQLMTELHSTERNADEAELLARSARADSDTLRHLVDHLSALRATAIEATPTPDTPATTAARVNPYENPRGHAVMTPMLEILAMIDQLIDIDQMLAQEESEAVEPDIEPMIPEELYRRIMADMMNRNPNSHGGSILEADSLIITPPPLTAAAAFAWPPVNLVSGCSKPLGILACTFYNPYRNLQLIV